MPRLSAEATAERDRLVLRMYLAVRSYREIGRHPSILLSLRGVHLSLKRSLPHSSRSVTEVAEIVYLERLEMMLRSAWPDAVEADLKAIEAVRRVLEIEARFFGPNAGD